MKSIDQIALDLLPRLAVFLVLGLTFCGIRGELPPEHDPNVTPMPASTPTPGPERTNLVFSHVVDGMGVRVFRVCLDGKRYFLLRAWKKIELVPSLAASQIDNRPTIEACNDPWPVQP